jgi:poly(3-hydroxybutyrate) depolymerase
MTAALVRALGRAIARSVFAASSLAAPLPALHATINETSVSGVSAGGYMAVQVGVAHSSVIRGVGVIAAGPYYCAEGNLALALTTCLSGEPLTAPSIALTRTWAAAGLVDSPETLSRQRVWLFSGTHDSVVKPSVVHALEAYYAALVPKADIRTVFDIPAAHGFVTDSYGSACDRSGKDYVVNCGYDAAGEILKQSYGVLKPRATQPTGKVVEFDQGEFAPADRAGGLAEHGYVYIPADCAAGKPCKVHIALHGCLQDAARIGDAFYAKAGYNAWADANSIIVLYPQVVVSNLLPMNPQACWDWWGYTGLDYAQKTGPQIQAIYAMLQRLAGKTAGK